MIQTDLPTAGFGETLRGLRRKVGWTLERTARTAGISRVTLNRWEIATHQPRLAELNVLFTALSIAPQQRRALIGLMDAPRATAQTRRELERIAERKDIGPMPIGGDALKAMRLREGLSLPEVARRLGVTTRTLRFWENGEIRPSAGRMQRFGAAVNAQEGEIAALCAAPIWRSPGLLYPQLSLGALEEQGRTIETDISRGETRLIELRFLSLESAAWSYAAKSAQGRRLLAFIFVLHTRYRSLCGYSWEAGALGERALELMPCGVTPEPFYADAVIYVARAYILSPHPGRRNAALRQWLPVIQNPEQKAFALSILAESLAAEGALAEALIFSEAARRVAERSPLPGEWKRRSLHHANILLQANRPGEALSLMADIAPDNFYFGVDIALARTRTHIALGEKSTARDWLQRAFTAIEIIRSTAFRETADALSRLLQASRRRRKERPAASPLTAPPIRPKIRRSLAGVAQW